MAENAEPLVDADWLNQGADASTADGGLDTQNMRYAWVSFVIVGPVVVDAASKRGPNDEDDLSDHD